MYADSGVGGFGRSGGVRARLASSVISGCLPPLPHPCTKKISPDFYVLHGPHWAAQGGGVSGPLDPPGQGPLDLPPRASYAAVCR